MEELNTGNGNERLDNSAEIGNLDDREQSKEEEGYECSDNDDYDARETEGTGDDKDYEYSDHSETEGSGSEIETVEPVLYDSFSKDIFSSFYEYLTSADSSNKNAKSSLQCKNQVYTILKCIDNDFNIQSLLDPKLIRDIFLKHSCPRMQFKARTVQAYIKSLQHFYDFLLCENFPAFDANELNSLKIRAETWKKGYRRAVRTDEMRKMEEDRRAKITPKEILQFESSDAVRNAVKFLGFITSGEPCAITQKRYTSVRDFIFTEIYIDNAHRAGVLANMTMGEFESKEKLKNGKYRITVYRHKEERAGPIRVEISAKLYNYIKIYKDFVRPHISECKDDASHVFLTWTGNHYDNSGGISNAVNAMWKKAGMLKAAPRIGRVNANKFRKAAISATRELKGANDQLNHDLANLMGHKKSTADRYYFLEDKMKSSSRAADALPTIMRTVNEEKEDEEDRERLVEASPNKVNDHMRELTNSNAHQTPQRHKFSEEEIRLIDNVFAEEILEKKISMDIVTQKIKEHELLVALTPKRVYNRIRTTMKYSRPGELSLPGTSESMEDRVARLTSSLDPDLEEVIPPSTSSKRANAMFSNPKLLKMLRDGFREVIKGRSVRDELLKSTIKSNPFAKQVADVIPYETIKNRIKYEIRTASAKRY